MRIDDVWAGKESAWHVVVLTEQLVRNPHSRVFAERGGTPELQGWDATAVIAARTHNLIAGIIAGLSSGTSLDDLLIAYPSAKQAPPEPKTLAELFGSGALGFFGQ
ncbi:hypothetical protein [Microbacterium trichothecenolyticum]|uniref:Uncharacterized protein n=1 Tax=Microbacterium trichothecenolyticum TaxID=69370 RepID=A0A0M2H0K1_MICTR|nr:hypothetical protein [Microbacterium trichothecenolyticum]KJL39906.1 hypothetical protein RS82_04119 [Microbacterium trichothecenolyticum]